MTDQSKIASASKVVAVIATVLIFCVVIALFAIMLVPPKTLSQVDIGEWFGKMTNKNPDDKCSTDASCSKKCNGLMGCCARCINGNCETGALTSKGCMISSGTGKGSSNKVQQQGGMFSTNQNCGSSQSMSSYNQQGQMNSALSGAGAPQCTNNQDAFMSVCSGDKGYPGCCGVCSSGMAWQGIQTPDGSCQTSVQQTGYPSAGLAPPNTYVVSSSGPKVGVTMGSCTVSPMTSGLQNHAGFFDSCMPNMAPADYGRPGSYGPSYSSCG